MDLRSIINSEAGESSTQKQAAPVTPIQGHPQQGFRDFSHPPQASPGKHPSQDYGPGPSQTGGQYASPTSYQAQGPYSNRPPPPPPIQAPPQNDLRSPAGSYSAQSPYRQTPTSAASNQYPFPQSPAQHHQYAPEYRSRDSYPQPSSAHLQHHNSQGSVTPQTPPIGIPGAAHPYLQHQRSHSSVSTSTPTSAQSQPPYFNQYPQESPVSTTHFASSQIPQHQRQQSQQSQQSQPGTPLGPPVNQRQSSGGFTQPTSPYQQRGLSSGPFSQFQTSPAPPPPASIPRPPTTPGGYDSQRTSTSEPNRRSQSERERSLSVSPKTRLPSQPRGDILRQDPEIDVYASSTKRKMADREFETEPPRPVSQSDSKPQVNGNSRTPSTTTSSPQQPPRKRSRYTEPPIWARSVLGRSKSTFGPTQIHSKMNGKQASFAPQTAPPPFVKAETNGHHIPLPASQQDDPSRLLGPWEKSITGKKPFEQITKIVADWLFLNVVSRGDDGELASRGVEIEIEAKLGQLIDRETHERYFVPVQSECVLRDNPRVTFKSSMTEMQHRALNAFLNQQVAEAHPNHPENSVRERVPIAYLHRRETDKFYELPPTHLSHLPPAVREKLNPRHAVKVRVSYDQKNPDAIIAKIIKARVADLDIYNPAFPLDCRISINFEMRYDGDIEELKAVAGENRQPDRNKDRLSYSQSLYQIDLTQITQNTLVNGVKGLDKEHELEIEVSTQAIREQGRRAAKTEPNEYITLVEGLLDNVRVLARATPQ